MSGVLQQLRDYGQWANSVADTRTGGWFLMSSPLNTYSLVALYLVMAYCGPRVMASRQALDLKLPMLVYNFALVILSAYMFKEFFVTTVLNPKFNVSCEAVDYSDDPMSVRLAGACWWFFFSKIIELLDTVIFMLRKKNNQISFLHVYHHATMPVLWWIGVRYVAGGSSFFSGMVNCFIHVLMYGYYFLSALGPWIQPYLWWKKYLTSLQLIQFFTVLIHCGFVMYHQCGFPNGYVYALIAYLISHILLFSNFYNQQYVVKAKKGESKKNDGQTENGAPETPGRNGRYNLRERSPRTPYKE
eukprot:XP_011668670.1 PREDICTED: elongation of very long chain fatty acids protein 4 isoform X1 [Strongylocentrotus purpuratus]